jgi:ubiquinone/menaquinone biosynthesis C-methylase UbiE
VQLATEYAAREGVSVDFRHGDVAAMPFAEDSFDAIVCEAAFKNFARPVAALDEMYRVLRPGGTATVHDMNRDATRAEIAEEVARMRLSGPNAFVTRTILGWLRRRAYAPAKFEEVAAASAFGGCTLRTEGVSLVVSLTKGS